VDVKFINISMTLKLAKMMGKAVEGGGKDDVGGGRIINKYDDPNYYGYSELLNEKATDVILDKIIKRLKLTDQQKN